MIERKNYVAQIRLEDQNNIRRSSVPARRALGLQRVYKFIRCFATIFSLCICSSVHFFAIYFHFLDTKILREKVSANQHRRDDIASRLENAEARSFSKAHSLKGFSHPRFPADELLLSATFSFRNISVRNDIHGNIFTASGKAPTKKRLVLL